MRRRYQAAAELMRRYEKVIRAWCGFICATRTCGGSWIRWILSISAGQLLRAHGPGPVRAGTPEAATC